MELIVSVGVFALVTMFAVGAYLMVYAGNQRAQGTILATNELTFALETMVRSIRTGSNYSCDVTGDGVGDGDCPGGGYGFVFTDDFGVVNKYKFDTTLHTITLQRGSGAAMPIVDPGVTVVGTAATYPAFFVTGTGTADGRQPYVMIRFYSQVALSSKAGGAASTLFQTSAAQRGSDL
jgi:hypothetical protein